MDLRTEIKAELWDVIHSSYEAENYTHAILDAIRLLSDVLREKSGEDGDGVQLVGKTLGGDPPLVRLNKFQTQSEKDEQQGIATLLRGIYQAIRNPRSHERMKDDKKTADAIIIFLNFILDVLSSLEEAFTFDGFLERVTDPDFVQSSTYATLLIGEIPKNKQFDTLINLYRSKNSQKAYLNIEISTAFALVIKELLKIMPTDRKQQFFLAVSEELKIEKDEYVIRQNFQLLPPENWAELSKVARLRIENKILSSIKVGEVVNERVRNSLGWLATWTVNFIRYFDTAPTIKWTLLEKLGEEDHDHRRYVVQFFMPFIYDYVTNANEISSFVAKISEAIIDGNEEIKNNLLFTPMPKVWKERFIEAMKDKVPDIIDDLDDVIPF